MSDDHTIVSGASFGYGQKGLNPHERAAAHAVTDPALDLERGEAQGRF